MTTQADEDLPPRKRTRASPSSDESSSLARDEEFWYDDGTLILIAANIEFRVYRGPLAQHSPVFRDLLALPQPPPSQSAPSTSIGSDTCPPCPTVHVTDSPSDLRQFLRAFVPGRTLEPLDAPKFAAVSAWIRLGHKYEVDKLVENSLQYLRRFYPKVLSDSPFICPGPIKKDRPTEVQGPHAIAIVNLARLTGSHDLLPLALLECCKLGASIATGYTREDGTVENLPPDDLGRCFAAKEQLLLQVVSAYLYVFESVRDDFEDGCLDSMRCREALNACVHFFQHAGVNRVAVDELLEHERMESLTIDAYTLCENCHFKAQQAIQKRRKQFWEALPRRFDVVVDGWALKATE